MEKKSLEATLSIRVNERILNCIDKLVEHKICKNRSVAARFMLDIALLLMENSVTKPFENKVVDFFSDLEANLKNWYIGKRNLELEQELAKLKG